MHRTSPLAAHLLGDTCLECREFASTRTWLHVAVLGQHALPIYICLVRRTTHLHRASTGGFGKTAQRLQRPCFARGGHLSVVTCEQRRASMNTLAGPRRALLPLWGSIVAAAKRLTLSVSPKDTLKRMREHRTTRNERMRYGIMAVIALFSMVIMEVPPFPYKLIIPLLYLIAVLVPFTSQLIFPGSPILCWLLLFYSCRFIPESTRPHIWVSVLPTLETVLYGANISDILTRVGHPILDILAFIPYGVVHFAFPFVVAALVFVFAPSGSVQFFANAFGWTNVVGVLIQILFPCAPPWYELREGLVPANYSMRGSPAGLARIDAIFGAHGYTVAFSNAPVVFGAFPSLHAATATMEALFLSYFFPGTVNIGPVKVDLRLFYWGYCFWLYWCTMYLMHHYLIDLVAGGCLATLFFYRELLANKFSARRTFAMSWSSRCLLASSPSVAHTHRHQPFPRMCLTSSICVRITNLPLRSAYRSRMLEKASTLAMPYLHLMMRKHSSSV